MRTTQYLVVVAASLMSCVAAQDRIAFSFCSFCSPPTSPGGQPNCNTSVYQHNGDGDGGCDAFATGEVADGGCTRSDSVGTPRGEATYEVVDDCESKGPGSTKGSLIVKAGPIGNGYNCLAQEGQFTTACGLTYACSRIMECIGT